jgi:hypothetical protein
MAVKPDSSWVRRSFLVKKDELDPQSEDYRRRFFTTAVIDYTDTRPGGSICINPPASRTRFADIRVKNALTGSLGKGRAYKEIIDDNSQIIHMRFGIEMHNSLTSFFTGFYNSSTAQVARTGRIGNKFFYALGQLGGFVIQLASWKLLAVHFLGAAVNFLSKVPKTKFYYSKPAMPLYWNAVSTMVNHMAVNRGVVPRVFGNASEVVDKGYTGAAAGPIMHDKMPTLFGPSGSIDVYALANRAKRLERQRMKLLKQRLDQARDMGITDLEQATRDIMSTALPLPGSNEPNLEDYLKSWFEAAPAKSDTQDKGSPSEALEDTFKSGTDQNDGLIASLVKFGEAELDDGAAFASFRVNSTGTVQDSFTNSVGESNLSSRVNGMSADMRSKRFDFADGNLVGGAVGALFGEVKDAVTSFGQGVLDSVQMSGLATLAGNAFVDLPKYWQSSMANLARSTYTMNLVSAYGNPISQIINLDIPVAMILAGVLPKSTGAQSYTAPFLVELYDQGRCQTRLGMIDSVTITRGTGNVGFTQDGKALGIDVTFSVVDMSSIMHMPITENFSFGEGVAQAIGQAIGGEAGQVTAVALTGSAFTPDTVYSDYLAVMSGMALNDQIYGFRNLKLNLTRKMAQYEQWKSPAHLASFLGDTFPIRALGMFYRGTDKQ